MKALHQRIRIFMIKMGSDVRTLDEYFQKNKIKLSKEFRKYLILVYNKQKNYNNLGTDVPQTAST